jgi:hypothetical protein
MLRVLVASPDKEDIIQKIEPAIQSAGASCLGYVISADTLAEKVKALRPDLVILRMDLARRGEEQVLLEALSVPVAIVLPRGRAGLCETLKVLPKVCAVAVMPDVDYARLVEAGTKDQHVAPAQAAMDSLPVSSSQPPATLTPAQIPARTSGARRRAMCLVFAGVKGGVGTTTALCALAMGAATLASRVGMVDLTGTGDVQATLPHHYQASVLRLDRAELASRWPRLRSEYDLVLVDAGRFPLLPLPAVGAISVCVTRDDSTDRLLDAGWIAVTQADRAPVGLKAVAVLPEQPDLYAQIADGRFLQPGPLLDAASAWAHAILHHEVQS